MRHGWFRRPKILGLTPLLLLLGFIIACGSSATATAVPATAVPQQAPQPTNTSAPAPTSVPSTGGAAALPTAAPTPTQLPPPAKVEIVAGFLNVGVGGNMGAIEGVGDPGEHGANNGIERSQMTIFDTLVISAPNGDLVPRLFKSWDISTDSLTWTFHLEEDIPWHKGYGELTASDVVWTWERATIEGSKFGRATPLRQVVGPPTVVEIIDDYTIKMTTETPKFDALFSFRAPYGAGLPMQSKKAFDDNRVNDPIGTGPWQFVRAKTSEFWEMEAVIDHWRSTPHFSGLKFFEIPEESTRLAALQTGALDTGEVAVQSLAVLRNEPGFKFVSASDAGQMQIHLHGNFYSVDRPGYKPELPWVSSNGDIDSPEWATAVKVRLALAIAIDRELIVEQLINGEGRAQYYFADSGNTVLDPLKVDDPTPFLYDPDRAEALLSEAGYADGFDLPMACYTRGLPSDVQVCEAVAAMWESLGINTTVTKVPYGTLRPLMFDRNMEVVHPHGLGTYPEPMALWPNSTWVEGGWNAGFEHPILDELIQKAQLEANAEARYEITREISRFMRDNVTHIPVYVPDIIYPAGPKIDPWPLAGGAKNIIHNLELIRPRS